MISRSAKFTFRDRQRGFTLIELLLVLAIVATLAVLRLPALANTKGKAQASFALHNLEQLTRSWTMYALDNNDRLVPNYIDIGVERPAWVLNNVVNIPGITNLNDIRKGLLYKYNNSVEIYRCPADPPRASGGLSFGRKYECVRTFSMNGRMNSDVDWVQGPKYPDYRKLADITKPPPASNLVFIEENPWTIDDGFFSIPVGISPSRWQNSPVVHHKGSAGALSFADGHAEMWLWVEPTTPKIKTLDYTAPKGANDRDLKRLQNVILIRD